MHDTASQFLSCVAVYRQHKVWTIVSCFSVVCLPVWSVCLSVFLSVSLRDSVSLCWSRLSAEWIEMPFGGVD